MTEVVGSRELFTFPPQQAGEPSTRNWYQELLDHPGCQNNPANICEAYEQFRTASLARTIASCLPAQENGLQYSIAESREVPEQFITPDAALIRYLKLQEDSGANGTGHGEIEELSKQDVNCLVVWARPDTKTLNMLLKIQNRLSNLVGPDIHIIPPADIHLSVIELSHRHSVPHLRSVYNKVGVAELKRLLDVPRARWSDKSVARLVRPMIMFDKVGVAVGFVPADDKYTHHHLRNQLHTMALATGVSIDTCYTAPLAHVTVGRFIGNSFFEASPQGGTMVIKRDRMQQWVDLIHQINEDLRREYWDELSWVVGAEKGLEVQLGYVKFGRGTDHADLVGDTFET
ncbi:RNA ligase/cyclic nucleotide phosphodiesterase [Aspergillus heterothallicus]